MLLNCGAGEDSESPLDSKEIKPVHPKGNQLWTFIGRTDSEAEAPVLWTPDAKIPLIWKDPDAGKDCGQEEEGVTEDEMFGWHHWLNGHEFEQAPGDGEGQGSLACCGPWGHRDTMIEQQQCMYIYMCSCGGYLYIYICIYNFPKIIFPYRLLQNIKYSSLYYTGGPCW